VEAYNNAPATDIVMAAPYDEITMIPGAIKDHKAWVSSIKATGNTIHADGYIKNNFPKEAGILKDIQLAFGKSCTKIKLHELTADPSSLVDYIVCWKTNTNKGLKGKTIDESVFIRAQITQKIICDIPITWNDNTSISLDTSGTDKIINNLDTRNIFTFRNVVRTAYDGGDYDKGLRRNLVKIFDNSASKIEDCPFGIGVYDITQWTITNKADVYNSLSSKKSMLAPIIYYSIMPDSKKYVTAVTFILDKNNNIELTSKSIANQISPDDILLEIDNINDYLIISTDTGDLDILHTNKLKAQ
jgi:hypothetical protein